MKIGDWVHFQTRNWPKESASVKAEHDSDKGFYTGSGKIVGIVGNHITVREEKSDVLVEVGPHPDDRVFPFTCNYEALTLGQLRQFLDQHKDVPDDTPVTIALPLTYFGELQKLPLDHPRYKEAFECEVVDVRAINLAGFSAGEDYTDNYIPPEEWDDEIWEFTVELTPHPAQCFDALRRPENEQIDFSSSERLHNRRLEANKQVQLHPIQNGLHNLRPDAEFAAVLKQILE